MENVHQTLFNMYYKHRLLYINFVVNQTLFRAARDFEAKYWECMTVDKMDNPFNREWKERYQRELLKFNGKVVAGDDGTSMSISDATSEGMKDQKA